MYLYPVRILPLTALLNLYRCVDKDTQIEEKPHSKLHTERGSLATRKPLMTKGTSWVQVHLLHGSHLEDPGAPLNGSI